MNEPKSYGSKHLYDYVLPCVAGSVSWFLSFSTEQSVFLLFQTPENIDMSTKMLGWLVGARDGKKLGSSWDPVNSIPTLSQTGPFQSFAVELSKVK